MSDTSPLQMVADVNNVWRVFQSRLPETLPALNAALEMNLQRTNSHALRVQPESIGRRCCLTSVFRVRRMAFARHPSSLHVLRDTRKMRLAMVVINVRLARIRQMDLPVWAAKLATLSLHRISNDASHVLTAPHVADRRFLVRQVTFLIRIRSANETIPTLPCNKYQLLLRMTSPRT